MAGAVVSDGDGDTKADAGDTIRYTATISATGGDAPNVHLTDTVDPNTTLVPGSLVISPLAINESYESVGNLTLTSATIGGTCATVLRAVTCNDSTNGGTLVKFGPASGNITVDVNGSNTVSTAGNGTVLLNTDGTFVYNPAAGFEGADSFWYTLSNAAGTDSAQVTINVGTFSGHANGMVWFVASGAAGTGRQANPMSLAALNTGNLASPVLTNPDAGDTILLFEGSHIAPVTLRNNQKLIGQDTTASLSGLGAPAAQPGNAYNFPLNPTVSSVAITSAGVGITLGSGNTLAGFLVGNSTTAIAGGTAGTVNVREVAIATNGRALDITSSAAFTDDSTFTGFTSVTSTGGSSGVSVVGVSGTLRLGSGDLNGNTAVALNASGGNGTIIYSGTIRNSGGRQVNVDNKTGGTVALSGAVSGTGAGVFLNANSATTINLTGGVTLSTGTNAAFTATGGGNLSVTGSLNSLTTTTGTALNITNTAIGASGVTFQNITASGGAPNGIVLSGTSGTFAVSGTTQIGSAGAGPTGTGISIANYTSGTISFGTVSVQRRGTTGILIDNMDGAAVVLGATTIPNTNAAGGYGIRVQNSAAPVTVASATIDAANQTSAQNDSNGDGLPDSDGDGDAIFLSGNTGTFTLNGGTLSNCGNDCIDARSSGGLTISGVTISNPGQDVTAATGQGFGGHGIFAYNVTGTNSISGSTVSGFDVGNRDGVLITSTTGTATTTVLGTTFQNAIGNQAIISTAAGTANLTLTVGGPTNGAATNCTFSNILASAITTSAADTATMTTTIRNSTFQNTPINGKNNVTGGTSQTGHGTFNILNNTFNSVGRTASTGEGLISIAGLASNAGNTFATTIQGNVISNVGGGTTLCGAGATFCAGPLFTILVVVDSATNTPSTLLIDGNTITNAQQGGIKLDMANTGAGSSAVNARIVNNTLGTDAARIGLGGVNATVASGIIVERRRNNSLNGNVLISGNTIRNGEGSALSTLNAPGIFVRTKANSNLSATITGNNVDTNSSSPVAEMRLDANANDVGDIQTPTQCDDITGNTFPAGAAALIDINRTNGTHNVEQASSAAVTAANGGVTVTPDATVTFGVTCASPPLAMVRPPAAAQDVADAGTLRPSFTGTLVAAARDTWTRVAAVPARATTTLALTRPFSLASSASSVMHHLRDFGTIAAHGVERAVPQFLAASRAAARGAWNTISATVEARAVPPVETDLGTIPDGKTLTVVFDVTVNTPPVASYSNHATIQSTTAGFGDVDTNTVTTTGDRYNTTTALLSSANPSDQGIAVTFTATVTPSEGSGFTPDGTVQFKDGLADLGSAVACADAGGFTCSAQLTTSGLAAATHSISAQYLGGTNHDASASTTVSQVVNACTTNPLVVTNADSGAGSLRQAIADACAGTTISFDMGSVVSPIGLTSGELAPARNVTISGPGAATLTVTRASVSPFRILHVNQGLVVTVSGLTLSNGAATGAALDSYGGAILSEQASLTILRSAIRDNTAGTGGGIFSRAASADGSLTIADSAFSGNSATTDDGGGLISYGLGGGNATLTVTNSTFSGNTAASTGGGISTLGASGATITNATITDNRALSTPPRGGGLDVAGTPVLLRNSIIARNYLGASPGTVASDVRGALDPLSANNLIGDGSDMTGIADESNGNQVGTLVSPIDPKLGPLANNGGATQTHALLAGSPAIDAGDDTFVVAPPFTSASPITDQRGTGFTRVRDSADSGSTATVDIGAFEVDPSIENITDKSTNEDTALPIVFNVGDGSTAFDSITASSSNAAVVPNLAGNLAITGSGATRTLTVTPALNVSGTATITVTATRTLGGTPLSATDTFDITVNPVNDAPTLDAIANPTAIDEDATLQTVSLGGIGAGGGESQTLTVTATSDNTTLIPNPVVTYTSANATGSLAFTPAANAFGSATITVTVQDAGGTLNGGVDTTVRTFTVTVNPVPEIAAPVPSVTTAEDAQTTSGLSLGRGVGDGAEVNNFQITGITNGTLFQNDGTTPIANDAFITFAQGGAGLKFTPAANFFGSASFTVQAAVNSRTGPARTVTITVNPVADTPSVTNASTLANVQTSSGLVIAKNAADGAEVTHFKVTSITNGTLFQNDGTTPIGNGAFITLAQGGAGLRFTPASGSTAAGSFQVQASLSSGDAGVGGSAATATITVAQHTSTTTVVSANPNPSDQTQPITVVYTVASADGGPAPTGNVTVSISGGSESCSGTVAAGQCTLTPTIAGTRNIVATYAGDTLTAGSASSTLAHTVNACSINPIVTSAADDGSAGTLRTALSTACFGSAITFNIAGAGPHTIALAGAAPLALVKDVTISGPAGGVTIDGSNASQIVVVNPGVTAALNQLTLTRGAGDFGAAIFNLGSLAIAGSTVSSSNAALAGGGIGNLGTLTITGSTLSGNSAGEDGGALWNSGSGDATIANSTISGNTAVAHFGGGIDSNGNSLTLTHVTITGNTAGNAFGGVALNNGSIANSIVAGNTAPTGANASGNGLRLGANLLAGDPKLGPLQNNGGPTFTHLPLPGSPALDAGDNTIATTAGLTTDQRGSGFARARDGADADTTQTVDIGAVEADPMLETLTNQTIDEDGSAQVIFNVGDAATAFDSIVATSSNTALLPNLAANIDLAGTGSTRTLTLTPAANQAGTSTVTVTATKTVGGVAQTSAVSFTLTVNGLNDPPTLAAIADPLSIAEDSPQQTINLVGISAGGGESQGLTVTATSDNTALIPHPTVTYASANATGSLAYTPAANNSGTATITVTVTDDQLGAIARTFLVTVAAVADTPTIDNALAFEDGGSGIIRITKNAADGAEVTHFKVLSVTGGSLALNTSGLPAVSVGQFLTVAQGSGGVIFLPAPNSVATGHVTVQASIGATDAGLGGGTATADITVTAVPDAPAVTSATTREDTQTTTGLVLSRNAADGAEVTHFKILDVFNGSLFQQDGVTPIVAGQVITAAQGAAGLRFSPAPNFSGSTTFLVIGALDAAGTGNGAIGAGVIDVTPVADTPSITSATTTVGTQTTSGLVVSRNAADGAEVGFVKILSVTNGTLFQNDGTTAIAAGSFITVAHGSAGLRFTPAAASVATGQVNIQASLSNTDAGLGGGTATATITVNRLPASVVVASAHNPSVLGEPVTFTAIVSPTGAAASGTVQFKDGAANLGSPVALAGGVASLTTSALTGGTHTIAAEFSGNTLYLPATGSVEQVVAGGRTLTTGADAGGSPHVRRFNAIDGGTPAGALASFFAFDPSFAGGVRVAEADMNGDGVPDVIAARGPGAAPQVTVFDGATGATLSSFFAYDSAFRGGVFVAAGDVDGDGRADIITGAGAGAPLVRAFSGASGTMIASFEAFGATFTGGVRVAAGDVDGDGRADVIASAGAGASSVRVFSGATSTALRTFAAYPGFSGGAFVAAGDVNGDGYADIVTGADAGGGPHVKVFDGVTGGLLAGFFAAEASFSGGIRVAAGDVNGDGRADVITGRGPGGPALIRVTDVAHGNLTLASFTAYGTFTGGVFVATTAPSNQMVIDTPVPNQTIPGGTFRLSGWALQESGATGTSIDAVHVWAYPDLGLPFFLGEAVLGDARPDVAAIFGARFLNAGYHLDVTSLPGDHYQIVAYAHNAVTGRFALSRLTSINVPKHEVLLSVDLPIPASTIGSRFRVSGWTLETSGAAMDAVHVYAYPIGAGAPVFLGVATLGDPRPDVMAVFGPAFANSGFHLDVNGLLAPGDYSIVAYGKASIYATFTLTRSFTVTVAPNATRVFAAIETPSAGTLSSGTFTLAGWALSLYGPSAPGIETMHVWAVPVGAGTPQFLGVTQPSTSRPDIATMFGLEYMQSGFHVNVTNLPAGTWDIAVFIWPEGGTGFTDVRVVRVTVPAAAG